MHSLCKKGATIFTYSKGGKVRVKCEIERILTEKAKRSQKYSIDQ